MLSVFSIQIMYTKLYYDMPEAHGDKRGSETPMAGRRKKRAPHQPKPHKDVFWQGYGVTPQSGLRRFLFFQAVSLYSCGFALILAIRLLISSSVGMSISPIAVK